MSDEQVISNISNISYAHMPLPLTPVQRAAKQKKFLKAYRDVGIIKYACKAAGINRSTFYYWRDHDELFKAQLPEAEAEANETLEQAAFEQAVHGVEEQPVVSMGKVMYKEDGTPYMVRKYSPQLLQVLLKARMPEKYKEKTAIEHTGKDGGPVQTQVVEIYKVRIPDNERNGN